MRLSRWLSLLLALCLLASMLPAALAEDIEIAIEDAGETLDEFEAAEVGEDVLANLADSAEEELLSGEEAVQAPEAFVDNSFTASAIDASYAKVKKSDAPVYFDFEAQETIAKLAKGEVVLITGESDGMAAVAMNVSGKIVEGYMKRSRLSPLSDKARDAYLSEVTTGEVALFRNDLSWPLGKLTGKSDTKALSVMAANYTEYDNNTPFTINGKVIRAGDEPTKGLHNCWAWAQVIYKKIWGTGFDSTFEGTASKGYNLARKLTDNERKLTPENLKHIVSNAKAGATIRVQACPSSCSGFNTDGCSKHNKHSLIIAEIREDGFVTMDDQGTVPHTRYYTWQGFCNAWKKWVYVKYVKWPNAPALSSSESIDGYAVTSCSETYRVRSTASKGAGVYSLPSGGKGLALIQYPATFKATAKTLKTVDGCTWAYGKSSTGVTGWLPINDAVAGPNDTIQVTGVALSQTTLILLKGGTATLTATVAPVDATNQSVSWASSSTGVVSVSNGTLTGVAGGSATITVTTADGSKTASCKVQVVEADGSKSLTKTGSNGTVKLPVGMRLQLVPTFAMNKGWKIKGASSSKSKYASVSKAGIVTGKKVGTTTITVKTKNGKKATLKVKVVKATATTPTTTPTTPTTPATDVEPTKIYLSATGTISLKVGKTKQLYTALSPSGATTTYTWKSTNAKVCYVDGNGKLYGLKKGTCTVGVMTANGKYATVKVKVS